MLKFSQDDNRRKTSSCAVYVCVLTLRLPEVINMKPLSFIFMHYPGKENTQTY